MADNRLSEEQRKRIHDDQKRKIISSVFSRRNGAGQLDETYVSHLKIWDGGTVGDKPRFILLSRGNTGSGYIHKSKLNQNETFSVGKTWLLADLRAISVSSPSQFTITLQRSYQWLSDDAGEQTSFIDALIKLFRSVSGSNAPLSIEGFREPDSSAAFAPPRDDFPRRPPPLGQLESRPPSRTSRSRPSTPSNRDIPRTRASSRSRPSSPSQRETSSRQRQADATPPPPPPPAPNHNRLNSSISSFTETKPPPPLKNGFSSSINQQRSSSPTPSTRSVRQISRSTSQPQGSEMAPKRDPKARISYFDPANQAAIDRLISSGITDLDGEEENARATMTNVEEMIENYEWTSGNIISGKQSGSAADLIEARLMDELMALEKANIHSFLESDDRIVGLLKYMDSAIAELDNMGSLVSSYKIHLNAVGDDILFIQSQNRGLQVQIQNQRALLGELENLLNTVQVQKDVLVILTQESLEKPAGIEHIEEAAAELYKALQAGRDTDMAATMERLQEYRTHNQQFCKRVYDYLSLRFTVQVKLLLGDTGGLTRSNAKGARPMALDHKEVEDYLSRYSGLLIYLKEMDQSIYAKLCASYFSAASEMHRTQIGSLFSAYIAFVKRASEDDQDLSFVVSPTSTSRTAAGMRRAGTLIRSPLEGRNKEKEKPGDGDLRSPEVLRLLLEQIASLIYHEDEFITTFLQVNDAALTFADYMGLDSYFRRQASRSATSNQSTTKLVRGAMDLIFGFLPQELKSWIDNALTKDDMQIPGLIACLERFMSDADDKGNNFVISTLGKQHTRLKGLYDRHVSDQIQGIEQTKVNAKKRNGVAPFIKVFPMYLARVESQLVGADGLEIRTSVDVAYDRIVQAMFESLKQMAKMDGEGASEDKGQINYHVILIENTHHFVAEMSQLEIGTVVTFLKKAQSMYDESLSAYVRLVLRRPFVKMIDFLEGVDRLLKTAAPTEVASNANYNKAALKKVVKEYGVKDVRKNIDVLFRRVEKHFTESSEKVTESGSGILPGTVLVGVWKACEDEVLRITELFSKRIQQCYSDSGITLDYTVSDVENAFRKHQTGSG